MPDHSFYKPVKITPDPDGVHCGENCLWAHPCDGGDPCPVFDFPDLKYDDLNDSYIRCQACLAAEQQFGGDMVCQGSP